MAVRVSIRGLFLQQFIEVRATDPQDFRRAHLVAAHVSQNAPGVEPRDLVHR